MNAMAGTYVVRMRIAPIHSGLITATVDQDIRKETLSMDVIPSLNGFLALNYPPLYEAFGAENSTQWAEYVENHVVIAPLWTNLDSRNITGAGVWVHVFSNNTGNRSDILQIQKLVRKYSDNSEFNASVAFAVTWKHNLSMQVIAVTDGLYTYLLFNYDQEEFSIQPNSYTPVAAGYTFPGNFTGKILANSHNFTNLKTDSNVNQAVKGRWLHDVTYITDDMRDEVGCRKFNENKTLKEWTRKQLKNSYPCPCYEQDMKESVYFFYVDSEFNRAVTIMSNPIRRNWQCITCFRFGELRKEYPFAIGAEYRDAGYNALLETGFRQCCSAVNSRRYCHLYYDVNPPDDCSTWSPDDEAD
ncbi:MLP-like protein, partial [Mya arenaria]